MDKYTFIMAENCDDCRDRRYRYLADSIKKDGYSVEFLCDCSNIGENSILILPFAAEEDKIFDMINKLPCGAFAVGGTLPPSAVQMLGEKNIKYKNLLLDEEFCIKNAIATAEGAFMRAVELTDRTIYKSEVVLLGYGRISKRLSLLIRSAGAKIKIFSTCVEEINTARLNDFEGYLLCQMDTVNLCNTDILVNTIPVHHIIDEKILRKLRQSCTVIDLASGENNVEWNVADSLGIKNYRASSLPGKLSPRSAAEYMKDSIYRFCECDLHLWQP